MCAPGERRLKGARLGLDYLDVAFAMSYMT